MSIKNVVRIENWMRLHDCLYGNVYGHGHMEDGAFVRTSIIVLPPATVELKDGDVVETRNTIYKLGGIAGKVN